MPQTKDRYVCLNGQYVFKNEPVLHTNNRAFLYADGFFETMFANGNNLPLFGYHYYRIQKGITLYKFESSGISPDIILNHIKGTITRNKSFYPSKVRVAFYRQSGGTYAPLNNQLNFLIETTRLQQNPYVLNEKGLRIGAYTELKKQINPFAILKNISAHLFVMAGIFKTENNLDECLVLNENNKVCESLTSNIFLVKDKRIFTPPLSSGCIDGVMRRFIIETLTQHGREVIELPFNIASVIEADECFLSNALGIKWVGAFKDKRYLKFETQKILQQLNNKLHLIE